MTSCIHRKWILPLRFYSNHYQYHYHNYHHSLLLFSLSVSLSFPLLHFHHYCISSNGGSLVSLSSSLSPLSYVYLPIIIVIVTVRKLVIFMSISMCEGFLSKQWTRIWVMAFVYNWMALYHAILFKYATTCFPWKARFGQIKYKRTKRILELISPWTKWPPFWQTTCSNEFF